ncbi:MAG: YgfZ/GcvT domain-containing protein [Acidimicrobiales bacterium]
MTFSDARFDLRETLGAAVVARDVVEVGGPDATSYLQGQLSQNVEGLDVGATAWSFVLQPAGKVDAWCRITRREDDRYLIDLDAGAGDRLVARLRRFLLRTKAEVEPQAGWGCIALRGPGAGTAAEEIAADAELLVPAGWPGVEGADLLGPHVEPPSGTGLVAATMTDYHALRIRSGVPAMGAELTERTIPAEVGQWLVDRSVDFTKGCFTGQELVARIDSRGGNVPRHLRGLLVADPAVPPAGATVHVDGADVGTTTSSASAAGVGFPVALAYVTRAVEPPADAVVSWPDGDLPATIHTLPLG